MRFKEVTNLFRQRETLRNYLRQCFVNENNKFYLIKIFNALCDLELHGPSTDRMEKIIAKVARDHAPFAQDGHSGWWNRFSHFAIYGAKYYSYVYAQAVAGRIWEKVIRFS